MILNLEPAMPRFFTAFLLSLAVLSAAAPVLAQDTEDKGKWLPGSGVFGDKWLSNGLDYTSRGPNWDVFRSHARQSVGDSQDFHGLATVATNPQKSHSWPREV